MCSSGRCSALSVGRQRRVSARMPGRMALQSDGRRWPRRTASGKPRKRTKTAAIAAAMAGARPHGTLHAIRATLRFSISRRPGTVASADLAARRLCALAGADLSVPLWTSGQDQRRHRRRQPPAHAGATAQEVRSTADLKLAVAESYVAVFRARRALTSPSRTSPV